MASYFDIFAVALFIATASIFFVRYQHENPKLQPFLIISLACALANWLGEHGMPIAAIALLASGSFLLLHITSSPYDRETLGE